MEFTILVLFLPLALAVVGFVYFLVDHNKDKNVRRWQQTHLYQADQHGNYPQYFNPNDPHNRSDILPGNSGVPDTYLIRDSLQQRLGKPKPGTTINRGGMPYSVTFMQSVDDGHLLEPETNFEPETTLSDPEIIEKLRVLKLRGEKQTDAIFAVTGCKPGAGERYKWAVEVWKAIPVEGRVLN